MNRTLRGAAGLLLLMGLQSALAAPTMTFGSASGVRGETVNIPVTFDNDGTVVGLQFEMTHDGAVLTQGAGLAGADIGGATINPVGPPTIAITDFGLNALNDGELVVVPFTIANDAPGGVYDITPSGLLMSDAATNPVAADPAPTGGTITVNVPPPTADVDPTTLLFGDQLIFTTSASQQVTVTNTGGDDLVVSDVSIAGDFAVDAETCTGAPVVATGNCIIDVTFTPNDVGNRPGNLTITSNAGTSPNLVGLSGTGVAPEVSLLPGTHDFGDIAVNDTSGAQAFVLSNAGSAPLEVTGIGIGGFNPANFAQTNDCGGLPATLNPGNSCTIDVTFTPDVVALFEANLEVTSDDPFNPLVTSQLTGNGVEPEVFVDPTSLAFPNVLVGDSASQNVTVTNASGAIPLAVNDIQVTAGGAVFSSTDDCPAVLPPETGFCTVTVTFTPTATGMVGGQLTISTNDPDGDVLVDLQGDGVAPLVDLAPNLDFGDQRVGTTSASQAVTLTNNGDGQLDISGISTTGPYAQTNNCGAILAPGGASCQIDVTFTPSVLGANPGTLVVTSNAESTPDSVTLAGNGVGPGADLSPDLDFGNVEIGDSAGPQGVTLTNTGTDVLNIASIAIVGPNAAEFDIPGTTCGATLAADVSCQIDVTATPAGIGGRNAFLSVTSDAPGTPDQVSLTVNGIQAAVDLSTTALTYGCQRVGTTSASRNVVVTNVGSADLNVGAVTAGGDFNIGTNDCGVVAPTGSCTIGVEFTPTATGTRNGTLSIPSNAPSSPDTVALSGLGFTDAVVNVFATGANQFTVEREGGCPLEPLAVDYWAGGSADPESFRLIPESPVVLPPGEMTTAIISVQPLRPSSGTVEVTIHDGPGYVAGQNATAELQLTSRPPTLPPPVPAISFWGMVLLGGLLGGIGALRGRRLGGGGRA